MRARLGWGLGVAVAAAELVAAGCGSSGSKGPGALGGLPGVDGSVGDATASDAGPQDSSPAEAAAVDSGSGSDGGITDASSCEGGQTSCSGVCTSTQTDPGNCGTCANRCSITGQVCSGGTCQCNGDAGLTSCSANSCANLGSDPTNCGACGHNCQGGTCAGSLCQPTQLSAPGGTVWDLAVTSNFLYWTQAGSGGAVLRLSLATPGNGTPIQNGLQDPRGLAVDLINVYWVGYADTSVQQVQQLGGGFAVDWMAAADAGAGYRQPLDVASDGANVYWTSYQDGAILAVPAGNPGGATPRVLYSGADHPIALAVDASNVYWVDEGSLQPPYNGGVYRIAKTANMGTATLLTPQLDEANPYDVAIDATTVYWVDNTNPGWVKSVPIAGGAITTLASAEGGPIGIATQATDPYVYWTDFDDNVVRRLAKNAPGQPPLSLATTPQVASPKAITVDQHNVYWVNFSAGSIFKVAK